MDVNWDLIHAVRFGKLEEARNLINSFGLSYSPDWSEGYVLLWEALKNGQAAVAKLLLTSGCKVDRESSCIKPSNTPLHFAVRLGDIEIVEMILDKGANINAKNKEGETPLCNAFEYNRIEILELLLKHEANVHDTDNRSRNLLLYVAAWRGNLKIVEDLLKLGANVNCVYTGISGRIYAPLNCAVNLGFRKIVSLLLSRGAHVDSKGEDGTTCLHVAAKKGYVDIAKDLVKHGACIHSLTLKEEYTPLHFASEQGNEEAVRLFLDEGADLNARTKGNVTPLHLATKKGHRTVVQLLLQHGAKVDNQDTDGQTILHLAVEKRQLEMVEDVLKYRPDINNQSNRSSLKIAVLGFGERCEKIVQALIEYGLIVNLEDADDPELLHTAVENGYLNIVGDLLKYGANVNTLHHSGFIEGSTPLHSAARNKQEEVAELLISYKADINALDKSGKTPIFYAIENANLKITKLLLSSGADIKDSPELLNMAVERHEMEIVEALLQLDSYVNACDKYGRTHLHSAAIRNQKEVAELLISYKADINALDKSGKTPIFYAIENRNLKMTKLLLSSGADIKDSPELLNKAVEKHEMEIVEALLQLDADVNACDIYGRSPLHSAAIKNQKEVAELLISYKADINALDKSGKTPLFYAIENRNLKMTKLLLISGADIKDSPELLNMAVVKQQIEIVGALLQLDADVNACDIYGITPLHSAAIKNQKEVAELLISYKADINALDKSGKTPLFFGIWNRNLNMTKLLLSSGATIKNSPELLNMAVQKQSIEIVKVLLQLDADVNACDGYGRSPLHNAAKKKCEEVAELLISYKADINALDNGRKTPIFYAIENADFKITKLLLRSGADIKDSPDLLNMAVEKRQIEIVKALLQLDADVNACDKYGRTPLHSAAIRNQKEVTELLISYKADINALDKSRKSPIFYAIENADLKITKLLLSSGATIKNSPELLNMAVQKQSIEIVKVLLQLDADVNACDGYGRSPLHNAAKKKCEEVAELLISYKADINALDNGRKTPIFYAIENRNLKMIKLLLSSGADIKDSPELLNMAVEKHEMEIVKALLQLDADVNACDIYGRSPLHSAAISYQKEVAELLISYKAEINALDKSRKTPIFYAIKNADFKITKLLLRSGADIKDSPELLNMAVDKHEMKIVKALLQHDADVNACDKYGRTALHIASQIGYAEAVATLLRYGADINITCENNRTPLDCAMILIHEYSYNKTATEVLELHIVKMRTANLYVDNSTQFKSDSCKLRRMEDDCKVEIEIMKCEKINNANVSFYDILTKGINSTAMYLRNEDVLLALKSGDYKRKFPLYAGMIELNFNKSLKRKELLEQVNKVSHFLFNNFLELPQDCTEKIFSYLNDKDLRILIEACKAI